MADTPTLIILAAGRSTRFGRPKQLEPVLTDGRTLIDLTLADAGRADAVLVVSPTLEARFREKYAGQPRIRIAVQREPLGTAHAVMQGLHGLPGTAVVVNGDDHYGHAALAAAMEHAVHGQPEQHALVAYRLDRTLSPSGGVNRALCSADRDGYLVSTREATGVQAGDGHVHDDQGTRLDGDRPVSMNLWIFRPTLFPLFGELARAERQGEYGLPEVVQQAIARGHRFRVIPTAAQWVGLTFANDADLVRRSLSRTDHERT